MVRRRPTGDERRLIRELLQVAGLLDREEWLAGLWVQEMDDGGMGSLRLLSMGDAQKNDEFGKQLSSVQFSDADGIDVIATLNANKDGEPFELDMWKTNFRPVIRVPESFRALEE